MPLWSNSCWFSLLLSLKLRSTCRRKSHILNHFWVSASLLFFFIHYSVSCFSHSRETRKHSPTWDYIFLPEDQSVRHSSICNSPKAQAWVRQVWRTICFRCGLSGDQSAWLIFKDSLRLSLHRNLFLSNKPIRLYRYYLFSQRWYKRHILTYSWQNFWLSVSDTPHCLYSSSLQQNVY